MVQLPNKQQSHHLLSLLILHIFLIRKLESFETSAAFLPCTKIRDHTQEQWVSIKGCFYINDISSATQGLKMGSPIIYNKSWKLINYNYELFSLFSKILEPPMKEKTMTTLVWAKCVRIVTSHNRLNVYLFGLQRTR